MIKSLSKSTWAKLIFDFVILLLSTLLWCNYFNLSIKILALCVCFITIIGVLSLFLKGNYKIREFNVTVCNTFRIFEGILFAHIPVILVLLFTKTPFLLNFIEYNIITIFVCIYLYRLGFQFYLFNFKKVKKVLIIGANARAKHITEVIKDKQALNMKVVGIVKSAEAEKSLSEKLAKLMRFNLTSKDQERINKRIEEERNFNYLEYRVFSGGEKIVCILEKTNPDIIIFTYKSKLFSTISKDIKIYLMTDFYEMATGKYYVDDDSMEDYAYDVYKKYENSLYDTFKRRLDVVFALIILLVTLPITCYIAVRIWLTDKASPFFSQTRVSQGGKKFECYKLRTMYVNDYVSKNLEMHNDNADRTMPFCKWIKKSKLDEIPQMINILKGEMSIVGPRAELEDYANIFEKNVPYYKMRNLIRAGWIGWADINMPVSYSVDKGKERLAYDLYYIKHRNIIGDLTILLKVIFLAFGGRHK